VEKNQKCRTIGSTKAPTKRKLAILSPTSRVTRQRSFPALMNAGKAKAESSMPLTISDDGLEDSYRRFPKGLRAEDITGLPPLGIKHHSFILERTHKLLKLVDQVKGECEVIKARMKRYIELEAKCESTMDEFDKYQTIISLRQKVESLQAEARGYRVPIPPRDGYVKRDRAEVVSKVVPYIAIKLVHSDEVAKLVGWIATFAIFYGRCFTLEEVYRMKEPFGLTKVKATTDPLALVEVLFSKKPKVLRHPTSSKTSSSSNLATPSTTPSLKAVSLC
ncbi:hypothetical protein Tco_0492277, partial [Tanacetum coccineum]